MVGPLSGVLTGQALAFQEACAVFGDECVVVDSAFSSVRKLVSYPLRLIKGAWLSRGPVYFTSSRSKAGFLLRDLPIFLIAICTARRLVNHLHGNDFGKFHDGLNWPLRWLVDVCYRHVALTCAPSASLLAQYDRYNAMSVMTIPNFFLPEIAETPITKSPDGPLEVIYLSNLMFSKGFTLAIEAVDNLWESGVHVHLTLCGVPLADGNMSASEVETVLDTHRGKPHITIAGAAYGQKKLELLSRAHVFVLPTTYPTEASPISILEALAAGCYVIATAQGAIPEMLEGFHADIQPADATAIAKSLRSVEKLGRSEDVWRENRDRALEKFSLDNYYAKIRKALNND